MEQSTEINELAKALNQAQAAFKVPKRNAENPFFKSMYSDLSAVYDAVREGLGTSGLSIAQFPTVGGVESILMHTSGQWLKAFCAMPAKDGSPQSIGSAISYARRYSLMAILGLANEDDDANAAEPAIETKPQQTYQKIEDPNKPPESYKKQGCISPPQARRLYAIAKTSNYPPDVIDKYLKDIYSIDSALDLKWQEYEPLITKVQTGSLDVPF